MRNAGEAIDIGPDLMAQRVIGQEVGSGTYNCNRRPELMRRIGEKAVTAIIPVIKPRQRDVEGIHQRDDFKGNFRTVDTLGPVLEINGLRLLHGFHQPAQGAPDRPRGHEQCRDTRQDQHGHDGDENDETQRRQHGQPADGALGILFQVQLNIDPDTQTVVGNSFLRPGNELKPPGGCIAVFHGGAERSGRLQACAVKTRGKHRRQGGRRDNPILQYDVIGVAHHKPEIWITPFQLRQLRRRRQLRPALSILCHALRDDAGGLFIRTFQPRIDDPYPADEKDDEKDEQECLQCKKALHQPPSQGSIGRSLHVFDRMR
ncbi:hypothetical protein D3C87_744360 [compost metagenome]